jgi:multiple sugar transport system permease protein
MNSQTIKRRRPYISRRGILLAVVVAVCVLPLFWTILASLQIWPDSSFTPPQWVVAPSLDQYLEVGIAQPQFIDVLSTSALLSACTTLLATSIAFFAAYSLARSRFRGRTLVVQCFLVLASLPVISYLIPLSNILDTLHLTNTFMGIALAETALYTPLAVYVLFGYFNGISIEMEESARLDGATLLRILRSIVLPASLVGVVATAIILFVLSWNQLLIPLVLAPAVHTIPTAMIDFFTFERELDWPTAAAALIVSLLPIGLFVAVAHRVLKQFSLDISPH